VLAQEPFYSCSVENSGVPSTVINPELVIFDSTVYLAMAKK
jgi:hypothetical protein